MKAEEIWRFFCNDFKISWEWVLSPHVHKNNKEQSKMGKAKLLAKTDRLIQSHGFVRFRLIQGSLMEYQFSLIMVLSKCSLSNSNSWLQAPWMDRETKLKHGIFSYSLPTLKSLSSVSSFLFIRPILHFSLAASTLHFVPSNKIKKVL